MSTSNKRAAEESESSDDDFGPAPLAAEDHHQQEPDAKPARKKIRKLEFEQVFFDRIAWYIIQRIFSIDSRGTYAIGLIFLSYPM